MTANDILSELKRRGVHLEMAGDKLRVRPRGAVDPDLVEAMRRHKGELLGLLSGQITGKGTCCPGPDFCAGCYCIGVIDGRERFLHPPRGKQWLQ